MPNALYFNMVLLAAISPTVYGTLAQNCSETPGDCFFGGEPCPWEYTNWTIVNDDTGGTVLHIFPNTSQGEVRSKLTCPTKSRSHCLNFFHKGGELNKLRVLMKKPQEPEEVLGFVDKSECWQLASVSFQSQQNFQLIFKGQINPGATEGIFLDNIEYKSVCNDSTTSAAPATSPIATIPATDHSSSSVTTEPSTFGSSPPAEKSTPAEPSPASLSIIIGVVISVVVLCAIAIVAIVIICRRRQNRNKRQQNIESLQTAMTPVDNPYSLPVDDAEESRRFITTRDPTEHEDTSFQPPGAHYETINGVDVKPTSSPAAVDDNDPLYAKVNKQRPKGDNPKGKSSVASPGMDADNRHDGGSEQARAMEADVEYNSLSFERKVDVPRTDDDKEACGTYDRLRVDATIE